MTVHEYRGRTDPALGRSFLLYLPGERTSGPVPLIYFLHGAGERGRNPRRVRTQGLPAMVESFPNFPFMMLAPQCPPGMVWSTLFLTTLLEDFIGWQEVDERRVYLTGMSMGGYATWAMAIQDPHRYAAIAPVCGGGNPGLAFHLKDVPVWAFHGDRDPVVPMSESRDMVEALRASGGKEVRFTIFPGVGHDSWTPTYRNPELYEWFLAHWRN
jgi:predicted peptidase